MKICLKELRETQVGLIMILRLKIAKYQLEVERLLKECGELVSIFVKSIETAVRNKMVVKGASNNSFLSRKKDNE